MAIDLQTILADGDFLRREGADLVGATDTLEFLADLDTFTRADVVNSSIGVTETWDRFWQVSSGWSITSGQLHRASGYGLQYVESHTSANITELTIAAGATSEWYMIVRVVDANNYMRIGVNGGVWYIDVVAAGSVRPPQINLAVSTPGTPTAGDRLKVYTFDDDSFDVFINDVHIWKGGDTQAVYSRLVGVAANGATPKFDRFKYTPMPGGIGRTDWMSDAATIVRTTGVQSVAGVKMFSDRCWVPDPVNAMEIASRGWVLTQVSGVTVLAAAVPTEVTLTPAGTVLTLALTAEIARQAAVDAGDLAINNLLKSMRPKVVGEYFYAPSSAPKNSATCVVNRMTYIPVWLREGTIDRIGVDVGTPVATAVGRLGIYNNDPATAKPTGAPIAEATGTQDLNVSGWAPLTISAVIPTMGRYHLGVVSQVAAATLVCSTTGDQLAPVLKGTSLPTAGINPFISYHESGATGALPTVGTVLGTGNVCPQILLRYSA